MKDIIGLRIYDIDHPQEQGQFVVERLDVLDAAEAMLTSSLK